MKLKIFLAALLLILIFSISSVAYAQTMSETQRQALIAQLQQQIALLMQQINQMLAQQQGTAAWCHTFNSDLGYANSGTTEVANLHLALQGQGISYSPDDMNTYSSGTYQGIVQFQMKNGISPQTGFVDPVTRIKLNQLYACNANISNPTVPVTPIIPTTCKPQWTCGEWGICLSGQQTKVCTDSNNCGVIIGRPNASQSCTQKPDIRIRANNSDGPINIFVTLGNGANVSSSGIVLMQNINLQWIGTDVASCMASDTLTPTLFSGYKPYSGSQVVALTGTIQGASSSNNKISSTFKINCISTGSGSSVSDNVTVNLYYTVTGNCTPNWGCTTWTGCTSGHQTRTCEDWNGCGSSAGKPLETQSCSIPPVVNIKANNSDGPITITSGSSVSLSWTSSNATSCVASIDWSGSKSTSGTQTVSTITSYKAFNITCTGSGGSATDTVIVNVTS